MDAGAENPRKARNPLWGACEALPGGGDSWLAMADDGLAREMTLAGGLWQWERGLAGLQQLGTGGPWGGVRGERKRLEKWAGPAGPGQQSEFYSLESLPGRGIVPVGFALWASCWLPCRKPGWRVVPRDAQRARGAGGRN